MTPEERRAYHRAYYHKNKHKRYLYNLRWYQKNRDKVRAYNRGYILSNREIVREQQRLWRAKNPEKAREGSRRWRRKLKNKIKEKAAQKRYYWKNREACMARSIAWQKKHPVRMLGYRMAGLSHFKRVEIHSEINNRLGIRDESALTPLEILIAKEESLHSADGEPRT